MRIAEYRVTRFQFARDRVIGDSQVRIDTAHIAALELIDEDGRSGLGFVQSLFHPLPDQAEIIRVFPYWPRDRLRIQLLDDSELMTEAKNLGAPFELVKMVKKDGRLPVPNFAAGGIATPADAALCMQLGAETVFVGSGIFKSEEPIKFAKAVVKATAHFSDPKMVLEASKGLGLAMTGIEISKIDAPQRMANRGW